ncbi:MAG: M28 family peptidase [Desulforhabdus sp.]|jgi:Zn-dependent M28 family amino/carboxypeptidase|nr:M28 family peptidase [Desulforhabdus sp.]
MDINQTMCNLQAHMRALTIEIGERSVYLPANLERAADYIGSFYKSLGLPMQMEPYSFRSLQVANVISEVKFSDRPARRYLLGAHYDSVSGTVGADDNASAIAVQLETARALRDLQGRLDLDLAVKCVSFALEEPPTFLTRYRGSRVHARGAKQAKEQIDGMLCLEMVGYRCYRPGCQHYPFPLMLMDYPKQGDFIGIVGNFSSRKLTRRLFRSFQKNPELPVVQLTVPFGGWMMPSVRLSDHTSFWEKGYKAVMITDTAFYRNPFYHTESDTMDKLDFAFMAELVKSLLIFFRSHVEG